MSLSGSPGMGAHTQRRLATLRHCVWLSGLRLVVACVIARAISPLLGGGVG